MLESDAKQVVRMAREMIEGVIPLPLGCKQLLGPLSRLGVDWEKPFLTIKGVESELDEFPIWPKEREQWNPRAMARKDAQLAEWLATVRPAILEACHAIIERFGEQTKQVD